VPHLTSSALESDPEGLAFLRGVLRPESTSVPSAKADGDLVPVRAPKLGARAQPCPSGALQTLRANKSLTDPRHS
jgi:hypothetical protein